MKAILYIALLIGICTYMFWEHFPKGTFYIGNALFIFLLSLYLFCNERKSFIIFFIFGLSLNNLLDELYFDNTILGINELALTLILPIAWFFKYKNND